MNGAVFIDSNIPMYLVGEDHPNKLRASILIEDLVRLKRRIVTSAEVLQEISHRFVSIKRVEFLQPIFDLVYGITDQILPITKLDVDEAKNMILAYPNFSARDALHCAVMKNLGINEIFSFDQDFDRISWIKRIS